jgi:formylglycine-generating enzyme required for sulfatase activity
MLCPSNVNKAHAQFAVSRSLALLAASLVAVQAWAGDAPRATPPPPTAPANSGQDPESELLVLFQDKIDITNSLGAVLVWIPAGFRVGQTEVTQAQYEKVMGQNPSRFKGPSLPVETVSPTEALAFCRELTAREQKAGKLPKSFAYDLPTEQDFAIYVQDTTLDTAVVSLIGDRPQPLPVASLPANPLRLHDVRGNVWEWCGNAVARGGSYQSHEDYLSPDFRFVGDPSMRIMDIGFRVVLKEIGR